MEKKFTIKDLAEGKCAVENNGNKEDIIEVLKKAFPKDCYNYRDTSSDLSYKFFYRYNESCFWASENETGLPTQSAKDFLEPVGFVKGKWYKGQKDDHYIKFDSYEKVLDYDKIHFTEGITDCNYKLEKDYWSNLDFERYALANPVSLEEIQKYLPEGHEDLISKEDVKFVLPENWHIVITKQNRSIVKDWFQNKYQDFGRRWSIDARYGTYKGESYSRNQNYLDTTEITFDQFKKYVLKEDSWSKKQEEYYKNNHSETNVSSITSIDYVDKQSLLEEAKKRYPIGTKYIGAYLSDGEVSTIGFTEQLIKNKDGVFSKNSKQYLVYEGKWAEIVEEEVKHHTDPTIKVGDKVRGFKFGSDATVHWVKDMGKFINEEGKVVKVNKYTFILQFNNGSISYPLNYKEDSVRMPYDANQMYIGEQPIEITKEYLTQENTVFHCETEEEAVELLKISNSIGFTRRYYDMRYPCYDFNDNSMGGLEYCKRKGYIITKASTILNLNKKEDEKGNRNSKESNKQAMQVSTELESGERRGETITKRSKTLREVSQGRYTDGGKISVRRKGSTRRGIR